MMEEGTVALKTLDVRTSSTREGRSYGSTAMCHAIGSVPIPSLRLLAIFPTSTHIGSSIFNASKNVMHQRSIISIAN